MKLKWIINLGRYINPETNRAVNVKKGTKLGRSVTVYFYLHRNRKIIINDKDFFDNWKKVNS